MNAYKVTGSNVIDGDTTVTKRITLEVMSTVTNRRSEIIVRPLCFSNTAKAEGRTVMGDEELKKRATDFLLSKLQNEEFVQEIEKKDPYTVDMPADYK